LDRASNHYGVPVAITVLDTDTASVDILRAPVDERAELLRSMLAPMVGMYRYAPVEVDLVEMHRLSSGFPLDRDESECLDALATMREVQVWQRVHKAAEHALEVQRSATPALQPPEIAVALVLGDPNDDHFVKTSLGISGSGGISGYIQITVWPTSENLERIEATITHELNHNLRYGPGGVVWDPATVTVGEHIVSEGIADAFARELYGDLGYTRIGTPHLQDDAVFARVCEGLNVTGMANFTAWVHGDAHAERFGAQPIGLPTGAGYAAGNRLVDTYCLATGRTAADCLHTSSQEIIAATLAD
jgi:uncharacterized protein YjaZ